MSWLTTCCVWRQVRASTTPIWWNHFIMSTFKLLKQFSTLLTRTPIRRSHTFFISTWNFFPKSESLATKLIIQSTSRVENENNKKFLPIHLSPVVRDNYVMNIWETEGDVKLSCNSSLEMMSHVKLLFRYTLDSSSSSGFVFCHDRTTTTRVVRDVRIPE